MFKKILATLLAVTAVLAFAACKKEEEKPVSGSQTNNEASASTGEEGEEGDIDYDADLSTERYDGYNYRMFIPKGSMNSYDPEEEVGDIVTDAIFKRNKQIEEKYGIEITYIEQNSAGYNADGLNSILAGDDAYDIIFVHSRGAFLYALQGAAYNINEINSIHTEKPWWYKDAVETFTLNDYLYVLDGDITKSFGSAMAIVFNKRIFDELGYDYPYETVRDGDWTFDEFAYYAKKGGADLNGDGVMTPEADQFGFQTGEWAAPINILYAGGQKIYDKNDEGKMELTLYSNKTVDIFDEFFSLMNNEACFLQFTEGNINYTGEDIFRSGRAMMASGGLGSAAGLRAMDDDFGIVPYPKFDEEDEYTTAINGAAPLIVIPITVSDVERTGAITEALCAYSAKDVIPAFYEVSLKTKYSRDEESEEMMDLIKDSIIYDVGYLATGQFQSCGRDMAKTGATDFSSFYAARESASKKAVEDYNVDYGHFE